MVETYMNYLVVLIAAVASMVVGFFWYSPILFGNQWMKLMGHTTKSMEKAKKQTGMLYGLSFVATLVTGVILTMFIKTIPAMTLVEGMYLSFLVWLGFVAPVQFTDVIFGGKQWKLFLINTGYQLAAFFVMGGILALWA